MLILRMFIMCEHWAPLIVLGADMIFTLTICIYSNVGAQKEGKACNTRGFFSFLFFPTWNFFWVHMVATCMPNTLTS